MLPEKVKDNCLSPEDLAYFWKSLSTPEEFREISLYYKLPDMSIRNSRTIDNYVREISRQCDKRGCSIFPLRQKLLLYHKFKRSMEWVCILVYLLLKDFKNFCGIHMFLNKFRYSCTSKYKKYGTKIICSWWSRFQNDLCCPLKNPSAPRAVYLVSGKFRSLQRILYTPKEIEDSLYTSVEVNYSLKVYPFAEKFISSLISQGWLWKSSVYIWMVHILLKTDKPFDEHTMNIRWYLAFSENTQIYSVIYKLN